MDPDYKRLLELSEENNKMLHKLLSDLRWRKFWGIVRWTIIIGSAIGLYYWLIPYLDALINLYSSMLTGSQNAAGGFKDILEAIKAAPVTQ